FSLTVPMTRLAVPDLGATIVGLGGGVGAGGVGGGVFAVPGGGGAGGGGLGGFLRGGGGGGVWVCRLWAPARAPIAAAAPGARGGGGTGIQPAGIAVFAALRAEERPPRAFWLAVLLGVVTILVFASVQGAGRPRWADLLLVLAMVASTFGHVEAAKIARELGG